MSTIRSYPSVLDYSNEQQLIEALQKQLQVTKRTSTTVSSSPLLISSTVEEEANRLLNLRSFNILDSEPEEAFDELTKAAIQTQSVSWSCLSLVDLGRQWFKSVTKDDRFNFVESSRADSFCAHTILPTTGDVLEVLDTTSDDRFNRNPLVTASPGIRYYVGIPLISPEGYRLGAFCVLDDKPRMHRLNEEQLCKLQHLARQAMDLLVSRRNQGEEQPAPSLKAMNNVGTESVEEAVDDATGKKRSVESQRTPHSPSLMTRRCVVQQLDEDGFPKKRSRSPIVFPSSPKQREGESMVPIINPLSETPLPDYKIPGVNPDKYLAMLVEAMYGVKVKVVPALEQRDFFAKIQEEQMAAYSIEVVSAARENNVDKLRAIFQERGREALDCYNRFGEGMLNLACRRGFTEMVDFLLHQVRLPVRICDDCGRTPLHDACWNPSPQLEICTWILEQDPSQFLVTDKRGYTPFQYARDGDWHIWRKFLYEKRHLLAPLVQPELLSRFGS